MIWIYNHNTETRETLTLEKFMERFNSEENFSNIYSIESIQYEYPHELRKEQNEQ